jgi:hypothetical protein
LEARQQRATEYEKHLRTNRRCVRNEEAEHCDRGRAHQARADEEGKMNMANETPYAQKPRDIVNQTQAAKIPSATQHIDAALKNMPTPTKGK